jgi:Flp pilus assembly pilin Flp
MLDRLNTMLVQTWNRLQREEGQGTAEYAIVLFAVVAIAGLVATVLSPGISTALTNLASKITTAIP